MSNPSFQKIIENNKNFLSEINNAMHENMLKNSNIKKLVSDLTYESDFPSCLDYSNPHTIHVCCSQLEDPEDFDENSFEDYSYISYYINLKDKEIELKSFKLLTKFNASFKINNEYTKILNEFKGIQFDCGLFNHIDDKIVYTDNISIIQKNSDFFKNIKFYLDLAKLAQEYPKEIYEYLICGKSISDEIKDITKLSFDFILDSSENNKYLINIENINLDFRKNKKTIKNNNTL